MESFLIEYNNRIIGVYSTFEQAELFILSCLQNNLINGNINILTYKTNSCYYINRKEYSTENKKSIIEKKVIEENKIPDKVIDYNDPNIIEINKKKIELQHNINILKQKKERLEELKTVYNNDIKLFEMFSENKTNNPTFEIPELFIEKYKVMEKLNNENNLNWESFYKEYKHDNNYYDYFAENEYEKEFNVVSDNDISEELDLETDSETDSSIN